MGEMKLSLVLDARDQTGGAIRSAMSNLTGFAKRVATAPIMVPLKIGQGSLALLRDINLGLRPLLAGLDNLIERGSSLNVIRKSFESLTGVGGTKAEGLARALVEAANGTVRLSEAMQIANRGLASGLSLDQLATAMDFISKKAATTGKNAGEALNTVITGLARGSTLFLDDFGVLMDGIEGVKRSFNEIKGAGAFEQLGPAAQKAEIIRQAIAEMRQQMGRIGVTGKETVFVWQSIKNRLGDAMESLVAAVARSKTLKTALESVRDVLGRLQTYFDKGGTLGNLLGGLGSVIGAGLQDLAMNLGRGLLAGILNGAAALADAIPKAFDFLRDRFAAIWDMLPPRIQEGFAEAIDTLRWFPAALKDVAYPLVEALNNFRKDAVDKLSEALTGLNLTKGPGGEPQLRGGFLGGILDAIQLMNERPGTAAVGAARGIGRAGAGFGRGLLRMLEWLSGKPDSRPVGPQASAAGFGFPGGPLGLAAGAAGLAAFGAMPGGGALASLSALFSGKATEVSARINWRGVSEAWDKLLGRLPKAEKVDPIAALIQQPTELADQFPLTPASERLLRAARRRAQQQYGEGANAGPSLRRAAYQSAQARIRDIAGRGFVISAEQRRDIFEEELKRMAESRMGGALDQIEKIDSVLGRSARAGAGPGLETEGYRIAADTAHRRQLLTGDPRHDLPIIAGWEEHRRKAAVGAAARERVTASEAARQQPGKDPATFWTAVLKTLNEIKVALVGAGSELASAGR